MPKDPENTRYGRFKVVLLGDSAVGKSSLVTRFVKDTFDEYKESTIGAAFITKTIKLDSNTNITFEIWDTAGQERYKSLAPMYYRNSHAVIIVFDLTDDSSFNKAISWINELKLQLDLKNGGKDGNQVVLKLIGNKLDLKDKPTSNIIDETKILRFIENVKNEDGVILDYLETSAKTGENVFKLFQDIAMDLPLDTTTDANYNKTNKTGNETIDLNNLDKGLVGNGCNC